jgi:hypothetical protein
MKISSSAAFILVKGQCHHEIFEFRFFHESVSFPHYHSGRFNFFLKFMEVFAAEGKFAAGIVDTSGKFSTDINNTSIAGGKICPWCH